MPSWVQVTIGSLVFAGAAALVLWWWGPHRWDQATDRLRQRLLERAPRAASIYRESDLDGLPAPVARYFRQTLRDGQPLITRARITWSGTFNMGAPGADKWAPFTAIQDFVPAGPGMVWDARIAMAPGLTVRVRDGYVAGQGSMQGAVLGLVPVVNKAGTREMAVASLQRYMAEATWLPTALLPSQGVTWTAIDDSRALATIDCESGGRASVEFRFASDGRSAATFVPARLFDDGKHPPEEHPWQARNLSFTTADGMLVPDEAEVQWLLPQGPYTYWRGRPAAIVYEYGEKG